MVPTMAALSFPRGWSLPRRRRLRGAGRVTVLAWALALAGLGGAAASLMFGPPKGALAIVMAPTGDGAEIAVENPPEIAVPADPAQFRRPAPAADGRPRVAVLVRGLGVSTGLTDSAIGTLPPDITLGLSAYGRTLQKQVDAARAAGHEVFLDVPVEPRGFPANDAGPKALLTSLTPEENAARLAWALDRASGYPGIVFAPGSPAADSQAVMAPLTGLPAAHGLIWAQSRARGLEGAAAALLSADVVLDATATPAAIDAALEQLEAVARSKGSALGFANAYPVSVARLAAWSTQLEARGIQLVPASALSVVPAS
jgi:polysaccharide deacetylase 2 family uncharacterized protein YibQ